MLMLLFVIGESIAFLGYGRLLSTERDKVDKVAASWSSGRLKTSSGQCIYDELLGEELRNQDADFDILRYRTMFGGKNNLAIPTMGFTGTPFLTRVPRVFSGGRNLRTSVYGGPLPNARQLSNLIFHRGETPSYSPLVSDLLTHVIQFLDHDLIRTGSPVIDCCGEAKVNPDICAPISIEEDDPDLANAGVNCINMVRMDVGVSLDCKHNRNEVLNMNTAWIDLDTIYEQDLRTGFGGLLRVTTQCFDAAKNVVAECVDEKNLAATFLPKCEHNTTGCPFCIPDPVDSVNSRSKTNTPATCCKSSDFRLNFTPLQVFIHTLFHRNHNKLARIIIEENSGLTDEQIFQEARRWNIAFWQNIIYSEVLPLVVGHKRMKEFDLYPLTSGYTKDYDEKIDARVSHSFKMAYRFGHSKVKKLVTSTSASGNSTYAEITDVSGRCTLVERSYDAMADFYRGMLSYGTTSKNQVTTALKPVREPIDIPAIDIHRGRDVGLAPYTRIRQFCKNLDGSRVDTSSDKVSFSNSVHRNSHLHDDDWMETPFRQKHSHHEDHHQDSSDHSDGQSRVGRATSFDDLSDDISESKIRLLKSMYQSVDDIDMLVGVMLETPIEGSHMGPTLATLFADQLQRLKKGDRFYYENYNSYRNPFTPAQLQTIRATTFSSLVCWNVDIEEVPANSFLQNKNFIQCSELPPPRITVAA